MWLEVQRICSVVTSSSCQNISVDPKLPTRTCFQNNSARQNQYFGLSCFKSLLKIFLKIVFRKSINSDPWIVKREYDQRRRKVKWIFWEMDCCFRLSCLESDHRLDHIIHFPCKQLGEMNYINPLLYDSVNVEVTGRRSRRRSVWATSSSETVDSLGGSLAVRWSNLPYKRRTRS